MKAQVSLGKCIDTQRPSLLTYTNYGCRKDSDQELDLWFPWICQHGRFNVIGVFCTYEINN